MALMVVIDKGPEERRVPVFTRHIKAKDLFSWLAGVSHLLDVCVSACLRTDGITAGSELARTGWGGGGVNCVLDDGDIKT